MEMCKGVILDATPDFEIKENDTYQPGVRISNYVCYPGGGAWVRWDVTKENDYVWSNRIEPCKEGNSPDVRPSASSAYALTDGFCALVRIWAGGTAPS